jgi:nitrate/nitrite transport system ATP-binding protein
MRQRCGLARAFSVQPPIMLLDEPFAQIDALTRGVIQDELIRMWTESGVTIFMVTHDVDEAILLSDRIFLMSPGPHARIAQSIDIPIARPRTRRTIIENPLYYTLRNSIIKFLTDNYEERQAAA